MSNDFLLALQITGLGMGLVFAAIILLWWMMDLLTVFTADKTPVPDSAGPASDMDNDLKAQAAAIAVVVALAKEQASFAHPLTDAPTTIVSAWQLGTRTRQLYEKRSPIVRKPRKIG